MAKKSRNTISAFMNFLRKERALNSKTVIDGRTYFGKIPKIREEVVREIKEKIEKGNYVIDCEKVAEKIIVDSLIEDILKTEDPPSKKTHPSG